MKVRLLKAGELDAGLWARWRELQQGNPVLASPFFCPEFTQAVAAVRPDVRVALLEDAGTVVGFFPHHRRWTWGHPVGLHFSDHHGVVAAAHTRWDWPTLLRGAGLTAWHFDHLPASQAPSRSLLRLLQRPLQQASSPCMDISQGMDAYRQQRITAGSRSLSDYARKARRMARALGPLRFDLQLSSPHAFEQLLRLKRTQYARTGVPDVLAPAWTRSLLETVWRMPANGGPAGGFAGMLSGLYAGDTLVALHLGMRSQRVWHWWMPVYEPAHAAFSPGVQLLLHTASAAADAGAALLDLGKGGERYKREFGNTSLPLVEGWVGRPGLMAGAMSAVSAVSGFSPTVQARHWVRQLSRMQALKPSQSQHDA